MGVGSVGWRVGCVCVIYRVIPIARTQFTKTSAIEDPLLQVPPARRGNRTRARFPSRSGGNLQEGGNCKLRPRDWYYSPHLNLMETVWRRVKGGLMPRRYYEDVASLRAAVVAGLKQLGGEELKI